MTSATYQCPICGNTDANSISFIHGKPYCRKCISFRGEVAKDDYHLPKDADFSISYELSYEQKVLSWKLIGNYKKRNRYPCLRCLWETKDTKNITRKEENMSKKKRKHKITLEIGKFYRVLDGSPGGHPGQIFKIDNEDKAFYAIITGSMTKEEFDRLGLRKGCYKLKHATDSNVEISLIKKRPFIGDRNDYGEKEYPDMSFSDEDMYLIIKVQRGNPIYGSYYKKRKKIKKPR